MPTNVREGDVVSVSPEEDGEGVRCVRFVIDPGGPAGAPPGGAAAKLDAILKG